MTGQAPIRFRAEREYDRAQDQKANVNLAIMAVVGNGAGVAEVATRGAGWYWIRLLDDDNRLTQCWAELVTLSDGDFIYVAKAKDRKLSYYEFVSFIQDSGGAPFPPICPKWVQVVTVSEHPNCQYDTLGEAVAYINGLVAGPAANRLFLILVMAGNFAEAGGVTIPQYVTVKGMGEASEIEMGANTLSMSSDTSLETIVVESSNNSMAVQANAATNVLLRDIRIIQTGGNGDCLDILTAAGVECRNVILEATAGPIVALRVSGAGTVALLEHCTVDDTTNFGWALYQSNNANTVTAKYCTFAGATDDVNVGAAATLNHFACQFDPDNSVLAGTHVALPTKRFNQTVIVAEEGGDFQTFSEAITYINAQGDAAAAKLYGVLMLAGNFAETGDVTIPQHVHVIGMGEGTEIEMGANTLFLDSDTSLESLVVESSDVVAAIGVIAEDNVVIRDVRSIQTAAAGTPSCFYFNSCTNVYLYNCIAEVAEDGVGYRVVNDNAIMYVCTALADTYSATTYGFQVSGTASVELYYCVADDDTNFADGLHLNNDIGCTCASRWCTFIAADDDVNVVGANATWEHFLCQFDPDNSTIAGTEIPLPTGKTNFDDTIYVRELEFDPTTELTIAAGVVTKTQSYHRIDTQGDIPSDDLDTINGGVTGDVLVIRAENAARTVIVKHGTGNIILPSLMDIRLDDATDHIQLLYDGANWTYVGWLPYGYAELGPMGTPPSATGTPSIALGDLAIASGNHSVVGGGYYNTASGYYATVGGGYYNTASFYYATVGGGYYNTASGMGSTVAGGGKNTASSYYNTVGGGRDNTASGYYSTIPGGWRAVADKYGQVAHASDRFAADGDAQGTIQHVVNGAVASHILNTWYPLYPDGGGVPFRLTIAASTAWTFKVLVVGLTQNAAQQWGYEIIGLIERDNANNTTLAVQAVTSVFESDAFYDAQVVADDANDALEVQVRRTGGVDYNVRWIATIRTVEGSWP